MENKVNVLFIDDQKFNHKVMDYILKEIGCAFHTASSGEEGIENALAIHPDLILLDIEMPGLNGFDTCRRFKAMPQFKETPIIFLSAHEEEEYIVQGFEAGGVDYIPKPFKPREVVARVQSHLEKFFLQNALKKSEQKLVEKNDDLQKALEQLKQKHLLEEELHLYKEKYHTLQQESAFQKQVKIITDHLSRRTFNEYIFDVFYKPLDILSGDAYGCIKLNNDNYFFYIVDAMGKGLSASVTSIQSMSFINNAVSLAIKHNDFNFNRLLHSYHEYIRHLILEDEIVCISFLHFNTKEETLTYSTHGMPPMYIEHFDGSITLIENNNSPIMEFLPVGEADTISVATMRKLLLYSDGLNEAHLSDESGAYDSRLSNDFHFSLTLNQLYRTMQNHVTSVFDDDMTIIMITRDIPYNPLIRSFDVVASYEDIENALMLMEEVFGEWNVDFKTQAELGLIANELLLNALEHGVLGIDSDMKQLLAENGQMEAFVKEKIATQMPLKQNIKFEILQYDTHEGSFIKLIIEDPGEGFTLETRLKEVHFDDPNCFHGRGIKIIDALSEAVYFNETGNRVHVIKKYLKGE